MFFSCNYPIKKKKSQYINKFISLTASDLDTNKLNCFELTCFNTNFAIQIKDFIFCFSKKKRKKREKYFYVKALHHSLNSDGLIMVRYYQYALTKSVR